MVNPLRADPTRTTLLRNRFVADMGTRFTRVGNASYRFLVTDNNLVLNADFKSDPEKLDAYKKWLKDQVDKQLIVVSNTETPWTDEYIQSSYKAATLRSWEDVRKKQGKSTATEAKKEFMSSFSLPVTQHRLQLLYTRCWDALVGVTQQMGANLSRTLADGLVHGLGAREVGKNIAAAIGVSKTRAMTIARTELINAYAEGQLDTFDKLGIKSLGVMVEHLTAGDKRVCPQCQSLNGKIYKSTDEARGLIPKHPNCVVGSSIIHAPDSLAVMRSKYSGQVVDITTAPGVVTSVTANHILLTQRGWVFAKDVTDSDYLINSFATDLGSVPDNNLAHPNIRQVFTSLIESVDKRRTSKTLPMPEYFHGDGQFMDSKIDIVNTEGMLWDQTESRFTSQVVKQFLESGHVAGHSFGLQGRSLTTEYLKRLASTTDSFMSSIGVTDVLFARSVLHHEPVSRNLVSVGNTTLFDDACGCASTDLELSSDSFNTASGSVEFDNLIAGKLTRVKRCSKRHVTDLQVFDVSTKSTMYSVNGLLTSNCRCCWVPYVDISEYVGKGK